MSVTISSKYQIVIPKEVRKQMNLKPGEKVAFIPWDGTMRMVKVRPIGELRGIAKGAPPFEREKKDREIA